MNQKSVGICWAMLGVVLTFSVAVGGPFSSQDHPSLLIQSGQYHLALSRLSQVDQAEDTWSGLFQKAYCLQELRRWDEAVIIYEQLQEDPGPLEEYLNLFLATCLFHAGRSDEAEVQLQPPLQERNSPLRWEAGELLGQIYLQSDRPQLALEAYRILAQDPLLKSHRNRFWLQMGRAHQKLGQDRQAAGLWADIMESNPSSAEAWEALQELRAQRREGLETEQLVSAGWVWFHHGQLAEAFQEWDRYSQLSLRQGAAGEALFLTAQASFRAKRYSLSETRCRRLLDDFPHSRRAISARYLLARCAQGQGQVDRAERLFEQFIADHPSSQLADGALRHLAELSEGRKDLTTAESRYWQLSQRYASRQGAAEALWRAGLYAYLRGDDATALARWEMLRQRYPQSELVQGALYWSARALYRSGQGQSGRQLLEALIRKEESGYYACRARTILGQEDIGPASLESPDPAIFFGPLAGQRSSLGEDLSDRLEKGKLLLDLGLLARARQELSAVGAAAHQHADLLAELLQTYQQHELSGDALRLAQQVRGDFLALPRKQALERYLFPLGQMETVTAQARIYGLDPLLILAIIRVESLFDPLAVSPAGAQGLTQVMPATGREIAADLGMPSDSIPSPFCPRWSIYMGAYYLWRQHQRFGGQTELALAAYNAGPGHVDRWRQRLGQIEPELFVELMGFRETRRYVKNVLATRASYRRIWGDQS